MANPKITLSFDQELLTALEAHTAALNRFCDMQANAPACGPNVVTAEPVQAVEPVPAVPEPIPMHPAAPVQTWAPQTQVQIPQMPLPQAAAPVPNTGDTAVPYVQTAPVTAPVMPAMPVAGTPEITWEQLSRAGVELMQRGVNSLAILQEFGVTSVTDLPKERYGEMAARLRQLGASI